MGIIVRRLELSEHQERRWLDNDPRDEAGGHTHANHTVPSSIRLTMQDIITSIAGVDVEARSVKRAVKSALKTTQHSGYKYVANILYGELPLKAGSCCVTGRLGSRSLGQSLTSTVLCVIGGPALTGRMTTWPTRASCGRGGRFGTG